MLLKVFLFFLSLLILVSCEKEEQNYEEVSEAVSQDPFLVTSIGVEEVKANPDVVSMLKKLSSKSRGNPRNKSKEEKNKISLGDYEIYLDDVKYIENADGNYNSFTFMILESGATGIIKNLFLSLQADGTYKPYIVSYRLTDQDMSLLRQHEKVDFTGKYSFEELDMNVDIAQFMDVQNKGFLGDCPPNKCCRVAYKKSRATGMEVPFAEIIDCGGGGGDSGGGGDVDPPNWGGSGLGGGNSGGGGGSGGSSDSGDPGDTQCIADAAGNCIEGLSTPVILTRGMTSQIFLEILAENGLGRWWIFDAASRTKVQFENFLMEEGLTDDSMAFALDAAVAIKDGGSVDFEEPLENYDFHEETTEILVFEQGYRNQMKNAEKAIFDNLSRFQQLDYLHSAFLAREYSQTYFENTPKVQYNGKGDAYLHCLWNALGASKLGKNLMKQLTDAHEVPDTGQPANPPLEKSMDLHNNSVGRNLGSQTSFMLMMKVKFAIDNGETKYLDPTDNSGNIILNTTTIKNTDR
jgi:hypothetical protein